MARGSTANAFSGTILPGGTVAEAIDLEGYESIGLVITTPMTTGSIVFEIATSQGGPWIPLIDDTGNQVATSSLTGVFALSGEGVIRRLAPYRYVRLRTSTAQTSGLAFSVVVKG